MEGLESKVISIRVHINISPSKITRVKATGVREDPESEIPFQIEVKNTIWGINYDFGSGSFK